jgi:hypothetical protein
MLLSPTIFTPACRDPYRRGAEAGVEGWLLASGGRREEGIEGTTFSANVATLPIGIFM